MAAIWIVHREGSLQASLARLAGAGPDAVLGAPTDAAFRDAARPDLVVLGLSGDFEQELEFAHDHSARHLAAAWILLASAADVEEARRLFDTLPVQILGFPPEATALRRQVRALRARRRAATLSERRARDAVSQRFARWFADLELPAVLRALDPHLGEVPLLIRGEPGTGRGLLAAYVHTFGGGGGGHLARIACEGLSAEELRREITAAAAEPAAARGLSLCLEEVEQLPLPAQRRLRSWIESGLPEGVAGPPARVRWIATCSELGPADPAESLDLALAQVLAGLEVRIPTLRERPDAVEPFAADTVLAWCNARGEAPRRLAADAVQALRAYPWPGNLRELEAVVARSLATGGGEELGARELRFDAAGEWTEPVLAFEGAGEPELPPAVEATPERQTPATAAAPAPPEPEPPRNAEVGAAPPLAMAEESLRKLVGAITHEVRNPLVAIRTFSSLLPERFDDPDFRGRFAGVVADDVRRIESTVDRLARFAALGPPECKPVDVSALLDELLEAQRDEIRTRRLVVLRELDREQGMALADAAQLRFAFDALLGKALELVPERGDIYVASRHHDDGLRGGPVVRVLMRFESPDAIVPAVEVEGISLAETALELVLADAVVRSQGGTMTASTADSRETVILIDLPA
jgi:DNA-binding NtrC family response regulator